MVWQIWNILRFIKDGETRDTMGTNSSECTAEKGIRVLDIPNLVHEEDRL